MLEADVQRKRPLSLKESPQQQRKREKQQKQQPTPKPDINALKQAFMKNRT